MTVNLHHRSLRSQLGCWWHERMLAERILLGDGIHWPQNVTWLDLCNRCEQLEIDQTTKGRRCLWQDSSPLTVARVFPDVGCRLLRHVLKRWPVRLDSQQTSSGKNPEISVLIPVGGRDRIKQFHLSLRSVLAQQDVDFEVIVVEQSADSHLRELLPKDVIYEHQRIDPTQAFNKSRALNLAADLARAKLLAIHDADFLLPSRYLSSCQRMMTDAAGLRPARWIVHLDQQTTSLTCEKGELPDKPGVEMILQNTPNPFLCTKSAYDQIGGHDESFVGWGGEDLEFLSRMRTRKTLEGGFLPVIHLWHPSAEKKASGDRNQSLQEQRLAESAELRIQRLQGDRHCGLGR